MTAVLTIEGLRVDGRRPDGRYQPIVRGISLAVQAGEVVALIGESGSGKTTTALAALGHARQGCRIVGGRIVLHGEDLLTRAPQAWRHVRGRQIAYVAQSAAAAFNPALTIDAQVTEAPQIHRLMSGAAALDRAHDLYQRLDLPEPALIGRRYPHQVSGGQLQRLLAAMAMACGPELLVLDEPTTALDVTTQIEVLAAIKELIRQQRTAVLYVSHDLAVVAQIADRIVVLLKGEVVEEGPTERILQMPAHAYTAALVQAAHIMPPLDMRPARHVPATASAAAPIVEAIDVTAAYGRHRDKTVLDRVGLSVKAGEVVGVIGESGCGKSSLARVLAGLLPPLRGQLKMSGREIAGTVAQRSKDELRRIQLVFQMPDVALNPRQRVEEILGRPVEFYSGLTGQARRARVVELLEMVELSGSFASRYPEALSGGQKQRVNLARALAAQPDLILCDEVTSSLDTIVSAAIMGLLRRLKDSFGLAYLFISHDLPTVAGFADRIVVLYAGRIVEQGPTAGLMSPPYHPYTRLLLSSTPEMKPGWLERVRRSREATAGIARDVRFVRIGCPFFNRCPMAIVDTCDRIDPPTLTLSGNHLIACHRSPEELSAALPPT